MSSEQALCVYCRQPVRVESSRYTDICPHCHKAFVVLDAINHYRAVNGQKMLTPEEISGEEANSMFRRISSLIAYGDNDRALEAIVQMVNQFPNDQRPVQQYFRLWLQKCKQGQYVPDIPLARKMIQTAISTNNTEALRTLDDVIAMICAAIRSGRVSNTSALSQLNIERIDDAIYQRSRSSAAGMGSAGYSRSGNTGYANSSTADMGSSSRLGVENAHYYNRCYSAAYQKLVRYDQDGELSVKFHRHLARLLTGDPQVPSYLLFSPVEIIGNRFVTNAGSHPNGGPRQVNVLQLRFPYTRERMDKVFFELEYEMVNHLCPFCGRGRWVKGFLSTHCTRCGWRE